MTTGVEAQAKPPRPVVLCILDGWGHRPETEDNAIACAATPNYDRLMRECPHAFLDTHGQSVGLPRGQMGNSEVGHMNIGSGRIVIQDLPRIDGAVQSGELAGNGPLRELIAKLKETGGTCHLMGLVSPGGVHSHQDHILALARILDGEAVPVAVHALLDGRDTPPRSALDYVAVLEDGLARLRNTRIVTVSGRYYSMDRDKRWDRTTKAYDCIVSAGGGRTENAANAIKTSYDADTGDEFVEPVAIGDYAGMEDGDGVLMANFRADRVRQILAALLDPNFAEFDRKSRIRFAAAAGMAEYSAELAAFMAVLFPKAHLDNTLGQVVSDAGLRQLRIAETEKYAHVTFFLSGGEETVAKGEDRVLVPSPRVATYDLKPEMSALEITDKLVGLIGEGTYEFIVVNYANADMVGHTGMMEAALKAVETVDECLGRLTKAVEKAGGAVLITADHGNIELMRDAKSGQPHTAHTAGLVPVILVNAASPDDISMDDGCLADVTPTVLELMGLAQPAEMTGKSLIRRESLETKRAFA